MKDFFKIFIAVCALAAAFVAGRNYGEKTYHEGEEYKAFAKASDDLNYAKSELENAKAKLQNIIDSAESKKTDELLGQILQVFLADLGLRIQNKEAILKRAEAPAAIVKAKEPKPAEAPAPAKKAPELKAKVTKYKSFEWMLANTNGGSDTRRALQKVQIKSMRNVALESEFDECEDLLGAYRGQLMNINKSNYGSLLFNLQKNGGYSGGLSWFNEANTSTLTGKLNNCGQKISGTQGRIFYFNSERFVQLYKLTSVQKIAGNFYEVLPNGTTKLVGDFILGRVDKF